MYYLTGYAITYSQSLFLYMCVCTPTFILVSQCCLCIKPFMFSLPSSYTQYSSCTNAFALWCFLFMLHHRFRDTSSSPAVAVVFQLQRHSESSLIRGQFDLIHLFIFQFSFTELVGGMFLQLLIQIV